MQEVTSVRKIKRKLTKEEFTRKALIEIAANKGTPIDVLESKVGRVREYENEYLLVTSDVELDYSCSVGYDRKEEYYVEERDFEKERKLNNGIKYYKQVKKTRTVTDWQPFSGRDKSTQSVFVSNSSSQDEYRSDRAIRHCLEKVTADDEETVDVIVKGNDNAIEFAKRYCINQAFYSLTLPGDHHKDERFSGSATVSEVMCGIFPENDLKYNYKGKDYSIKGFACGNPTLLGNYPSDQSNVKEMAKKKTMPLLVLAFALIVATVIFAALQMMGVGIAMMLGAVAMFFIRGYVRRKVEEKAILGRQSIKLESLESVLNKNRFKGLTLEERKKVLNTK